MKTWWNSTGRPFSAFKSAATTAAPQVYLAIYSESVRTIRRISGPASTRPTNWRRTRRNTTAVTSPATSGQRADRSRSVRYDDCRATQKPKKGDETNKKLNRLIYLTQQRKSPWLATVRWPFIVRPVAGASLSVRSLFFFWASLFVIQ